MIVFNNGNRFVEVKYALECEFEQDIFASHELFFGKDTVYIDAKRKIGSASLGSAIPDGFLFDMSDTDNREFYLVEVELASHDFFNHIFPQITKFFAFFKNPTRQKELVEKLFSLINADQALKQQFKKYLGEKEIYKFLHDVVDSSQNILIVIDGDKEELPEIMDTYVDTWGRMVKVITAKKFAYEEQTIYTLSPEFDAIEYSYQTSPATNAANPEVVVSEEFHLEGVSDSVKGIYWLLKEKLQAATPVAQFNIAKNYISIRDSKNISYLMFRKKKIVLVLMMPEDQMRERLPNFKVKRLSDSVQGYYNGPCGEIQLTETDHLDEVISAIASLLQ
jgi:predicted transport protein